MFEQDEGSNLAISVAIGMAVIFAVIFVLGLLCGLFGLILNVTEQVGFAGQAMLPLL